MKIIIVFASKVLFQLELFSKRFFGILVTSDFYSKTTTVTKNLFLDANEASAWMTEKLPLVAPTGKYGSNQDAINVSSPL